MGSLGVSLVVASAAIVCYTLFKAHVRSLQSRERQHFDTLASKERLRAEENASKERLRAEYNAAKAHQHTTLKSSTKKTSPSQSDMARGNRSPNKLKPAGLTQPCGRCENLMPYDPRDQTGLCSSCNRVLALGGTSGMAQSVSTWSAEHDRSDDPFPTPQPLTDTSDDRDMASSMSAQSMVAPQPLKRTHDVSEEEQYPSKRAFGHAYAPHTPSLLRRNVSPSEFEAEETIAVTSEGEGEGSEEFVDASEEQGWADRAAAETMGDGAEEMDAEGEFGEAEDEMTTSHEVAEEGQKAGGAAEDQRPDDDDDLFAQHFSKAASNDARSTSDIEHEASAQPAANNTNNSTNDTTTNPRGFKSSTSLNSLRTNQPPRPTPLPPSAPTPILLPTHLSPALRKHHAFHHTALQHLPRLPHPPHRYWIGVLKPGVSSSPTAPRHERDFTWIKANRLTTVESVWHAYTGSAADEDVVLLCGGFERVGWGVRCEELDYFDDRRVILRAVAAGHADAAGRPLGKGLIREVVDLLDDDGDGHGAGKRRGGKEKKEKKKGKGGVEGVDEVIVLD